MAELKTKPSKASVAEVIWQIDDLQMKADARKVAAMMAQARKTEQL